MTRTERIEAKRLALEQARATGNESALRKAFLAFKREQEKVANEIRKAVRT